MYLQEILEVAIGLVFVWLVMSIATMSIMEWIRTLTGKRSKDLEKAIRKMLADPGLAEQFYDHPLIRSLATVDKKNIVTGNKTINIPSYIPARQFALVLFDVIANAGTEASFLRKELESLQDRLKAIEGDEGLQGNDKKKDAKKRQEAAKEALDALIVLARKAAATDVGAAVAKETMEKLNKGIVKFQETYPALQSDISAMRAKVDEEVKKALDENKKDANSGNLGETTEKIQQGMVALGTLSPSLRRTLETLTQGIAKSDKNIGDARKSVEKWFDVSMERLSGTFKRQGMWWSLLIGFIFAVGINVDSIQLARVLWVEPTLRQALVAQASNFEMPATPTPTETPVAGETSVPNAVGTPGAISATGQGQQATDPEAAIRQFRSKFEGLNLPLGWKFEQAAGVNQANCKFVPKDGDQEFGFWVEGGCFRPVDTKSDVNGWGWFGLKFAGILISALATVQGAPFWFDILGKLINVRGTGKKPEPEGDKEEKG